MLTYICPKCQKMGRYSELRYNPKIRKFACPLMACDFVDRRYGNSIMSEKSDRRGAFTITPEMPWSGVIDLR
jgi:hypothetical protein